MDASATSHPLSTDDLLVSQAAHGDHTAFTALVRSRQQGVRRFLRHLCRDATLADDLAQQAFLKLWTSLGQLREAAAFNGWFKQILISVWLEELRRQKIDFIPSEELHESDEPVWRPASGLQLDLQQALQQLPPLVRLCVVLAYQEGHSHAEIAELLQLPLGTVKSHVIRGAKRLQQLLGVYRE